MVEDTRPRAEGDPSFGPRVRQFRRLKRMSLRELAELSDVSPSFLSQLENGHSSASIATLARVAAALGITIAKLFDDGSIGPEPLRRAERAVLRTGDGVRKTLLSRHDLEGVAFYGADIEPGGSTGPEQYSHVGGHEVIVVVRGRVVVELDEHRHELTVGDSIDFASTHPHRIVNEAEEEAELHWVVGPAQPVVHKRRRTK